MITVINFRSDASLSHHGIKGMRWGVRRYQSKDGSLTNAGKKRYYAESDKVIKQNRDGSLTIPRGFKFNRVGKTTLDVNKSGDYLLAMVRRMQLDILNILVQLQFPNC